MVNCTALTGSTLKGLSVKYTEVKEGHKGDCNNLEITAKQLIVRVYTSITILHVKIALDSGFNGQLL